MCSICAYFHDQNMSKVHVYGMMPMSHSMLIATYVQQCHRLSNNVCHNRVLCTPYTYIKLHSKNIPSNTHSARAVCSQPDNQRQALLDECCNERDGQVLSIDNTIMEHLESTKLTKCVNHVQQPALQVKVCNTMYYDIKGCSLHTIIFTYYMSNAYLCAIFMHVCQQVALLHSTNLSTTRGI